jgi:uncharacterized membrane protein
VLVETHTEPGENSLRTVVRRVDPAIAGLMAVGAAAAFYRLGTKGLWLDEAFSANYSKLGLSGLWQVISGRDPNMGLYYAVLHFWVLAFGSSEAAVRSLGAVVGALAVPFAVLLGTRLFGRSTGLVAGGLLALNPFFVQYEQTARSYTLVVLLLLVSCYAFTLALDNPTRTRLAAYVLASALSVYAHYFAALVLLVQFGALVALAPPKALRRRWGVAAGAIVLLCIPEAVFASRETAQGVEWIARPTFGELIHLPSGLVGGAVLAAVLCALACYGFVRAFATGRRWQAVFAAAWLLVPVALDFVESKFDRSLFNARYLIVVLPALLFLAAAGVAALPRRSLGVAVCGALVAIMLAYTASWYRAPSVEGFRGGTHYILSDARAGDRIVYYPELQLGGPAQGVTYYESRAPADDPRPIRVRLASTVHDVARRFWLVIRDSDVPVGRRDEVERGIDQRYVAVQRQTRFRNLTIILYRRKGASGQA